MLLGIYFGDEVDDLVELQLVIPAERVETTVDLLRERYQRYSRVSFPFARELERDCAQ